MWDVDQVPATPARDTAGIVAAAAAGDIEALVVGGVDPSDLRRPGRRPRRSRTRLRRLARAARVRRSRPSPTSCCRSPRSPRRPAPTSTGRAASAPSRRPSRPTRSATTAPSTCSRARWASSSRPARQREIHAQFEALGPWGGARATSAPDGQRVAAAPDGTRRLRPLELGHAARRRPHAGRRAVPRRHRAARRGPSVRGLGRRGSGSPRATTSRSPARPAASRCPRSSPRAWSTASSGSRPTRTHRGLLDPLGPRHRCRWPRPRHEGWCGMSLGLTAYGVAAAPPMSENPTADFSDTPWWVALIKAVGIFVYLLVSTLLVIWFERRVIGRMQQRPGPNRNGPFGLLQTLADGMKSMLKEDITPANAEKLIYTLAPLIAATMAFVSFAIIPVGGTVSMFGHETPLQVTDVPVAVLLVLAVASSASTASSSRVESARPTRCSVACARPPRSSATRSPWASRSSRSSSTAGRCRPRRSSRRRARSGTSSRRSSASPSTSSPWSARPTVCPSTSPRARASRTGGFHTEYSSMRFAMFFLGEYVNMFTVSALATTLFLGGWQAPPFISAINDNMFGGGWWGLLWFTAKLALHVPVRLAPRLPAARALRPVLRFGWKFLIPMRWPGRDRRLLHPRCTARRPRADTTTFARRTCRRTVVPLASSPSSLLAATWIPDTSAPEGRCRGRHPARGIDRLRGRLPRPADARAAAAAPSRQVP